MNDAASEKEAGSATPAPIGFAEFLESVPPQQSREISDLFKVERNTPGSKPYYELRKPQLHLHCTSDSCNGLRFFRHASGDASIPHPMGIAQIFLLYQCSNCQKSHKNFALHLSVKKVSDGAVFTAFKFGETPAYGPPTPPRLLRLFGQDREVFLKGRRCENQGLGVGAFGYYRRVVENHKNQILDEIIRVAEKVGAPTDTVEALKAARAETQFSKAVHSVRNAIPQVLLVNGQNPLTLLHSALSAGLHEESDERCLELAHDVRVVMSELAERMGQALKDEAELNSAVSRLMRVKGEK